MKKILYLFVLSAMIVSCGSSDDISNNNDNNTNQNANPSGIPETKLLECPHIKGGSSIIISHATPSYGVTYTLEWDCDKKAQRWSAYEMYNSNSVTNWNRNSWYNTTWGGDPFQEDVDIPSKYRTTLSMYRGSGYDRGHMCPSADRLNSKDANEQTFYLSNMQPQNHNLNAGIWEVMENQIRTWNKSSFRDTLYIVKGGTIDNPDQIKGYTSSGLLIPGYFFMAILCKNSEGYKAIAFWVDHQTINHSNDPLSKYVISIDQLEQKTGIDFFCNLPDNIENKVEAATYPSSWQIQ
ncbi:DNA/RNA non-specific endonuclease [Xylanibacter oryzae]|uniref:DNA/RNA non-specific endonuclease n=1 Tax=Xylanibacter oryzae TaxID=185293 RepID=UPI0004B199BF|nr:DNA/RNA non-specific endonuclease [Xylanibacter oryzae]